jgi:hypothetical protein
VWLLWSVTQQQGKHVSGQDVQELSISKRVATGNSTVIGVAMEQFDQVNH